MELDLLLENFDLARVFGIACIAGFVLVLYVMQIAGPRDEAMGDPPILRYFRRVSLVVLSITMLWAFSYSMTKGWQPWPPFLALVLAIDFNFLILALTMFLRARRLSHTGVFLHH